MICPDPRGPGGKEIKKGVQVDMGGHPLLGKGGRLVPGIFSLCCLLSEAVNLLWKPTVLALLVGAKAVLGFICASAWFLSMAREKWGGMRSSAANPGPACYARD